MASPLPESKYKVGEFRVWAPDEFVDQWTVSGVAPDSYEGSHYDLAELVRRDFPGVDFDPEQGTFFAYMRNESTAIAVAQRLDQEAPQDV